MYRSIALFAVSLLSSLLLAGCTTTTAVVEKIKNIEIPTVGLTYQIEVVQGNFVSREQVAALRVGMPQAQVKNILGTPLLTDVFHDDRWDYIFTIAQGGKTAQPRKLAVFFKDNALTRWEGDAMPSEVEFVQSLNSGRKLGKPMPLEATERQLSEFAKQKDATPQVAPISQPAAPSNKTYPSLESK
jgi:outer membrane protein assembly factor BamE